MGRGGHGHGGRSHTAAHHAAAHHVASHHTTATHGGHITHLSHAPAAPHHAALAHHSAFSRHHHNATHFHGSSHTSNNSGISNGGSGFMDQNGIQSASYPDECFCGCRCCIEGGFCGFPVVVFWMIGLIAACMAACVLVPVVLGSGTSCNTASEIGRYQQAICHPDTVSPRQAHISIENTVALNVFRFEAEPPLLWSYLTDPFSRSWSIGADRHAAVSLLFVRSSWLTYDVTAGGVITFYIMDAANYSGFKRGKAWSALITHTGSHVNGTVTVPSNGEYYFVAVNINNVGFNAKLDLMLHHARYYTGYFLEQCTYKECIFENVTNTTWIIVDFGNNEIGTGIDMSYRLSSAVRSGITVVVVLCSVLVLIAALLGVYCWNSAMWRAIDQEAAATLQAQQAMAPATTPTGMPPPVPLGTGPVISSDFPDGMPPPATMGQQPIAPPEYLQTTYPTPGAAVSMQPTTTGGYVAPAISLPPPAYTDPMDQKPQQQYQPPPPQPDAMFPGGVAPSAPPLQP